METVHPRIGIKETLDTTTHVENIGVNLASLWSRRNLTKDDTMIVNDADDLKCDLCTVDESSERKTRSSMMKIMTSINVPKSSYSR